MNKFIKIAVVLAIIGLGITVYKVGKKTGPGDAGEVTSAGDASNQDGSPSDSADQAKDSEQAAGDSESGKGGEYGNGDDFMGGVTGKSVGGVDSSGDSASGQDQNAIPREDGSGKTAGGGSAGGMPGASGVGSTTGAPGSGKVVGMTTAKPDSNCFSFEYKHQKEALNKDIEDFLDYSNAFPILHQKVSQKSICVKVNGKPVAHKVSKYKDQREIVIGSVVGPESVIKVSYCIDTVKCKEACAVKTNRFMDDLMSDTGDEDEFKESWGESKEQKKELTAKVKELRSVASENRDLQKQSTIRTWDTIQTNDWVCKK